MWSIMSEHIEADHCPSLSILSLHSVTSTSLSRERKKKRGWLHFRDWDYPSYDRGPALDQLHHHVRLVAKKVVRGKSGSSMEEKQSGQCKCLLIETLYIYIYHHGNYKNAYLSAPITMRTVKTQKNCVWFIGRRMDWNEMGSVSAIKACPINDIWIEYLGGCWRVLCNKYNILNENFVWWGEW